MITLAEQTSANARINTTAATKAKADKRKDKKLTALTILLFLLPALLTYIVFILYPIFNTFSISFLDWNGISNESTFVGLDNYTRLAQDSTFWYALRNNMYVVLLSIFVQIPLGLIMALILFSSIPGKRILNVLFFLPYLMSTVAVGLLWIFMYDPVNGPINRLFNFLGMDAVHWLAGGTSSLVAILIVIAWQFAPFYMILFRAAMVGIPEELYESAQIDGANEKQKFFYITLPSIMPTIVSSSILAVVGSLKTFAIFFIMTGGGSGIATDILGTYMYRQAFINFNMGYSSAIAAVMFLIALVSVIIIQGLDYRRRNK